MVPSFAVVTPSHFSIGNDSLVDLCQYADHIAVLYLDHLSRDPICLLASSCLLLKPGEDFWRPAFHLLVREPVNEFKQLVSVVPSHDSQDASVALDSEFLVDMSRDQGSQSSKDLIGS